MKILFPNSPQISNSYESKKYCNWLLVLLLFFLGISFYMVVTSTAVMAAFNTKISEFSYILKQFIFILVGLFIFVCTASFDYRHYKKPFIKYSIFILVLILLFMPLIFGREINGAKRWIEIKSFQLQPSEFYKIAFIIMMSDFFARKQNIINKIKITMSDLFTEKIKILLANLFKNLFVPALYFIIPAIILFYQKDMGTMVLIGVTGLAILFLAGLDLKIMLSFFAPVFVAAFIALVFSAGYRVTRFEKYFDYLFDISKATDNMQKAIYALGSGGILGKGPGNSEMKLRHLSEAHTDFIFPVIGEEFGFVGASIIIVLFIFLLFTGFKISKSCKDDFGKYMAFGIAVVFAVQAIINMSMATGLIPPKGIALPFISYGGSSMILSMTMIGILFNIARNGGKK